VYVSESNDECTVPKITIATGSDPHEHVTKVTCAT